MNLRMVREYFKLDSVAGQGDELSKIINLLHFVHDNIRHDGNNRAFAELDAIDLYNYYKTTGKGVNCRQLAISLCEMYLSMGIPARYVTCMPADSLDYECHVINTVWSSQLQKWLYIDPTMDAWVMDENGMMLSIAEVRERLIKDMPLVLCETANWNHESQQTKDYYLDQYMAKNLYYFVCKKISRFNPESVYRDNPPEGDIRLIPAGFVNNNWKCNQPQTLGELKSEYVTIDDSIRVHYKIMNSQADAKTICFVHGFGCDMNTWEKQFEALTDGRACSRSAEFLDKPSGIAEREQAPFRCHLLSF